MIKKKFHKTIKKLSVVVSSGPNYDKELILTDYVGLKVDEVIKFIKKNKYRNICVDYACLDCETSWNHDIDNPICWITSIQFLFQDEYFLFRKPSEFVKHLK